jgi:hypothetical protein
LWIEESEQEDPEVVVMFIKKGPKSCFHIAITCTNTDITCTNTDIACTNTDITCTNTDIVNADAVCSQAILCGSTEDGPSVYYAVYDSRTQMVFFSLCHPSQQESENVSHHSMQREETEVAELLKRYIVSNALVLYRRERETIRAWCY